MKTTSREHLKQSNMSYWYHCKHSFVNGLILLQLAFSSFIHAFFPSVLPQHAARGVIKIYVKMKRYAHLRQLQKQLNNE